jgi:HD-GYP domain-containing protein (c-di-GMP phosphodiesterase class II)
MTNDRPYRKALTFENFEAELRRCSGSQFDPKVVEMFLSIPRDRWFQLMHRAGSVDFKSLMDLLRSRHYL